MRIVDRKNPRKLYLQLVDILKDAIEKGELVPGNQLPTEDQLCSRQGVSKAVVRAALQDMALNGYIRRVPGKGTFIERQVASQGIWLSTQITENLLDFGIAWDTDVVQKMLTAAPSDLAELFAMEAGHQVFKVTRLRKVQDVPALLETSFVSHDLCPGLALEDLRSSSLLDIIFEKYSIPITRCADSVEITTLEDKEADLLGKEKRQNALLVDRILYTTNNRVVAFERILSISEDHRITFESVRTPGE